MSFLFPKVFIKEGLSMVQRKTKQLSFPANGDLKSTERAYYRHPIQPDTPRAPRLLHCLSRRMDE